MKTIFDPSYRKMIDELKSARLTAGYTQARAATALGWERTRIVHIESCHRRADILEVHALAKLYGISLAKLESVLG